MRSEAIREQIEAEVSRILEGKLIVIRSPNMLGDLVTIADELRLQGLHDLEIKALIPFGEDFCDIMIARNGFMPPDDENKEVMIAKIKIGGICGQR